MQTVERVVVVLLADSRRAGELAAVLSCEFIEAIVVHNAAELSQILHCRRVDLVVLQNKLNDRQTGLDLLGQLSRLGICPAAVLIAEAELSVLNGAKELNVRALCLPGENLESTKRAIVAQLPNLSGASGRVPVLARALVEESGAVHPLPQPLERLAGLLEHAEMSMGELANELATDAAISAALRRAASSPLCEVEHARDAVVRLGIQRSVSIALSTWIVGNLNSLVVCRSDSLQRWYRWRSLVTASTAQAFGRRIKEVIPETAYFLGVLQDIGMLVLAGCFRQRYVRLLDDARKAGVAQFQESEQREFHVTHADVSAAVLQKWGMPQGLVTMALNHHRTDAFGHGSQADQALQQALLIGEATANLAEQSSSERASFFKQLVSSRPELDGATCLSCTVEALGEVANSCHAVSECRWDQRPTGESSADSKSAATRPKTEEDKPSREAAADQAECVESKPRSTQVILVIEDEFSIVKLVESFVKRTGIEVLACSTLEGALQLADKVDAILCDVHLGNDNGIDIIRKLRARGYQRPVIMISGDRTRSTFEISIDAGVNDYLLKPFGRKLLLEKLAKHGVSTRPLTASCAP